MNEMAKLSGFEHLEHIDIPLPKEAAQELFFQTDEDDDRMWMPLTDNVWIRPLLYNVVQGTWCNIVKAEGAGLVGRHRHPAAGARIYVGWHVGLSGKRLDRPCRIVHLRACWGNPHSRRASG